MKRIMKYAGLVLVSLFFVVGGQAHFTATGFFVKIVPPYVPWPLLMVYVTGVLELMGSGVAVVGWHRARRPDRVRHPGQHIYVDESGVVSGDQPEFSWVAAGGAGGADRNHLVVDAAGDPRCCIPSSSSQMKWR
jgi:hypothetical protein